MNDPSADIEFSTSFNDTAFNASIVTMEYPTHISRFVLLLIGSSISILLLLEGYYIDDKFPGYGPKQRKLRLFIRRKN